MLDKIWKKIYPKIWKKPCYICLTQAVCNNKQPWNRTCDLKKEWKERKYKIQRILDDIENWIFVGIMIIGLIFISATFILGIWKWCDLIIYWFG